MVNKTAYQILSSIKEGIVEFVITGEVTKSTYDHLMDEADEILKAGNADKVLWDVRALAGRFAHEDVYARARSYTKRLYDIHNAIVDLPQNADFVLRYESKAVNAGVSLKCFTDMDAARAWLGKK